MTTEEKAKAYADKKIKSTYGISSKAFREAGCRLEYEDVVQAYEDGATESLASQWVSMEKRLPEFPDGKKLIRVLAWVGDEPLVCWYTCHGRFITTLAAKERYSYDSLSGVKVHLSPEREDVTEIVTHWLPIPPLKGGEK
ncbi:hypothetical protein [Muribaculum intestinale]|uniref:hypothetical protein n=1 Tax=Muribaculum intestinale TaxID=1796646 RepID=UPI0025A9BC72|nr:hypothetical protein [Muribaculum intestinale]